MPLSIEMSLKEHGMVASFLGNVALSHRASEHEGISNNHEEPKKILLHLALFFIRVYGIDDNKNTHMENKRGGKA
jgi:hypothetical protein